MTDKADAAGDLTDTWNEQCVEEARKKRNSVVLIIGNIDCIGCGLEIPELRRNALPGITLCVPCAELNEPRRETI